MEARPGPVPSHEAPTPAPRPPLGSRWLVPAAAVVVVALDQLTKSIALDRLADGPVHLVWTLQLKLSFNSGAAFGLGQGFTPVLVAVAVVLLVGLALLSRRVTTVITALALGAVLGGAAGNLADRLVRDHDGAVVDFIDLQWWPIFNLADAAITCGAIGLVFLSSSRDHGNDLRPPARHEQMR